MSGGGGGIPLSSPCVPRFDFHPIKVCDEAVIIAHSERYGTQGVNGGLVGNIEFVADIGGGIVVIHLRKFGPDEICKIRIAGRESLESDSVEACGPLVNIGWVRQLMPCGSNFGITFERGNKCLHRMITRNERNDSPGTWAAGVGSVSGEVDSGSPGGRAEGELSRTRKLCFGKGWKRRSNVWI